MSKTHTGTITNWGRKLSRWMRDTIMAKGPAACDISAISERIERLHPHLTVEERTAVAKVALVLLKRDFPTEHTRLIATHIGFKNLNPTFGV